MMDIVPPSLTASRWALLLPLQRRRLRFREARERLMERKPWPHRTCPHSTPLVSQIICSGCWTQFFLDSWYTIPHWHPSGVQVYAGWGTGFLPCLSRTRLASSADA